MLPSLQDYQNSDRPMTDGSVLATAFANFEHPFAITSGGMEYNVQRHMRKVDTISDRMFRCP